jgi:hypothetical protein
MNSDVHFQMRGIESDTNASPEGSLPATYGMGEPEHAQNIGKLVSHRLRGAMRCRRSSAGCAGAAPLRTGNGNVATAS